MIRRPTVVLLALLAAGCGQTGELFLPGERDKPVPGATGTQPAGRIAPTPTEDNEATEDDDEETPAR